MNKPLGIWCCLQFCLTLCAGQSGFDAFVNDSLGILTEKEMERWQIPGISIGIVYEGEIIYNKGFGNTAYERGMPVDENTKFMIGSLTKAMTCTAVFLAEHQGKLSIKDPVRNYITNFYMGDDGRSDSMTIEDFFAGQSGLRAHQGDYLFWKTKVNREKVLEAIASFDTINKVKSQFAYSNLAYMLLGEVLESATQKSWENFMADHFFQPLKMGDTFTSYGDIKDVNIAKPHFLAENQIKVLDQEVIENMGPAGSIISSSTDMLKWIMEFLSVDIKDHPSQFSEKVLKKGRRPYTFRGYRRIKQRKSQNRFLFYGPGWSITDYNDILHYEHNGGTDGFLSNLLIIPEKKFGVVILTNSRSHNFAEVLTEHLRNKLLGIPSQGTLYDGFSDFKALQQREAQKIKQLLRPTKTQDVALGKKYIGTYSHPIYGVLTIDEQMKITFGNHSPTRKGTLHQVAGNKFLCKYERPEFGHVSLAFEEKEGQANSFQLYVDNTAYSFKKVVDR